VNTVTGPTRRFCYIHIVTHKTGTTSIQAFLAHNRDRLLERGIFIPAAGGIGEPQFADHHGVVRQLLGTHDPAQTSGGLDVVRAELSATDAPTSCISSEDFSLIYDRPELLVRLRDAVAATGFEPKVIVYLRPQASYAVALYATNAHGGYRLPFETFLREVFEQGRYEWAGGLGPPFDYQALLDAFAAVFGHHAITARAFRSDAPDSALLISFMRVLDPNLRNLAGFAVPPKRANRTLTFSVVLRLLGCENSVDQHVRFAPLTFGELVRFQARFRRSNRQLSSRYGLTLPPVEPVDVLRALPFRRSPALTRQLAQARRMLRAAASATADGEP
jgi:hypothetical protein